MSRFRALNEKDVRSGSVEVVFHEAVGAHDVTVVRAEDAAELASWIERFLKANGISEAFPLRPSASP